MNIATTARPLPSHETRSPDSPRTTARNCGLSLVELLIAAAIGVLLLGLVYILSRNLTAGFRKGEETSKALQQTRLFIGTLRRDLANAAKVLEPGDEDWRNALIANDRFVRLFVHEAAGGIARVRYLFEPPPAGTTGGSIVREVEGQGSRTLVEGLVATLSWTIGAEEVPLAHGVIGKRIWLDLALSVGGMGRRPEDAAPVPVALRMFPVQLNRTLNWRDPRGDL